MDGVEKGRELELHSGMDNVEIDCKHDVLFVAKSFLLYIYMLSIQISSSDILHPLSAISISSRSADRPGSNGADSHPAALSV